MSLNVAVDGCELPAGLPENALSDPEHVFLFAKDPHLYPGAAAEYSARYPGALILRPSIPWPFHTTPINRIGFIDVHDKPAPCGPFTRAPPPTASRSTFKAYFLGRAVPPHVREWCEEQRGALFAENEKAIRELEGRIKKAQDRRRAIFANFFDLKEHEIKEAKRRMADILMLEEEVALRAEKMGLEMLEEALREEGLV